MVGVFMEFVKNNKIFLFLFISFSLVILTLSFFLVKGDDYYFPSWNNEPQYTTNAISLFNGSFNEQRKAVELSWNIQLASGSIDKFEIYHNDKLLRTGKNASSAVLGIIENDICTGNNDFSLRVTLSDGSILEKHMYVYIDEAFDFSVKQTVVGSTIVYDVEYYYDDRNIVNPPQMLLYESEYPFGINYLSANDVSKEGHIVRKNASYELNYENVEAGRYEIDIYWEFVNHNLSFNSTSIIDMTGIVYEDD